MFKRILVPLDGSICGEHALREGIKLAKQLSAEVTLLHVLHPEQSVYARRETDPSDARRLENAKAAAHRMLTQAAETAYAQGVLVKTVLLEDPFVHHVEAILGAETSHDLTILATHGRRGLEHFFLGSVTEAVLQRSSKPHLVIKDALIEQDVHEHADVGAAYQLRTT